MPTISVNGFEMHYQLRGNGQPLLLLHGGMGIGDDWRHVFPSDPPGYRVIVPLECVSDRAEGPHYANLFDINAKYGDVVPLAETIDRLRALPADPRERMLAAAAGR